MSDVKFTKGEWWVSDCTIDDVKGYEICWSPHGECVTDHVYEEADAHLMSAAKEMYAALDCIVGLVEHCKRVHLACPITEQQYEGAKAALAKARGETK